MNVAFAVRRKRSLADFATTQSPGWFLHANDTHSQNPPSFRGSHRRPKNPPVGSAGGTTPYCPAPRRGSPLREDDGGRDAPPASTVGCVRLRGGFHGLRPLNDGDLGSPRPLLRTRLAPHSPLRTSFRGSEAITPVSAANPAKRIASEKEEQGSGVERTLRRRTPPNPAVIQSLRQQAKNPPNGSSTLMTRTPQTLLSFSRSARESPKWFLQGNDNVLPRPSAGDPRFARMTEEGMLLPRPRLGVCASVGDSTACGL